MPGASLLIRNGRPLVGAVADVLVTDGVIAAIGPNLAAPAGTPVEDAGGALVLPGLVEAHTHLDKSLWGMGWRPNDAGPGLLDKIDNERKLKRELNIDPARQSARQAALSSSHGSTHIRSHVDVDTDHGLWGIEGVMATRDAWRDIIDIELVAFPQSGLMRRPGTLELMDAALAAGAEVVGGIDPCGIDRDPKGQLDAVFALCQKHAKPLDIHLHEPGEMGAFSMDLIFERTRALGMQGQVVVSHAFCLGTPDPALVDPMIDALAELDIGIMTTGPAARPAPPVKRLLARGIRVCSGSDGIRDTWGPYGNADMLERAMLVGQRNNFRRDEEVELAFHTCTQGGADVMRLADYGLAVGRAGDLFVVEGEAITHAVVARPKRKLVVKRGRVAARDGVCVRVAP
jgi:cytosine/adenosine deaminase-related metal-dependent hydrolase